MSTLKQKVCSIFLANFLIFPFSIVANADNFCSAWNSLVADAPNNFSSSPAGLIPGGDCAADTSDPQDIDYECDFTYPNAASAGQAYQALITDFDNCFPNLAVNIGSVSTTPDGKQVRQVNTDDFPNGAWIGFSADVTPGPDGTYQASFDVYTPN